MSINNLQTFNEQDLAALSFAPFCCYCLKTEEPFEKYTNHYMRKSTGEISCTKLQRDGCPQCGATGEVAHLTLECPRLPNNATSFSAQRLTESRKRQLKKKTPLRIKLLKRLHMRAERKYWLKLEDDFETRRLEQLLEEQSKTLSEYVMEDESKDSTQDYNASKIKRRRLAVFE